jgi:hypothetical protein
MRYEARHVGSGVWGVWDGGVMSWRGTDYGQVDAERLAADLNTANDQYGPRAAANRRAVEPPVEVEVAVWESAGVLEHWVRERQEWWGRVRHQSGTIEWVRAADLRRLGPGSAARGVAGPAQPPGPAGPAGPAG